MLRRAALVAALAVTAGCSAQDPVSAPGSVAESPASQFTVATASPASQVTVTAPTLSSEVSVTGEALTSTTEVRVAEILTELQAGTRPEGTVITLPELVLFDFAKADLKPAAQQTLADVAEVITFYADAPVVVRGHTDAVGAEDANQQLSERRAAAVATALTGPLGIDRARVEQAGFGETQPVAPNANPDGSDNPAGREQNRRVEIVLRGVQR